MAAHALFGAQATFLYRKSRGLILAHSRLPTIFCCAKWFWCQIYSELSSRTLSIRRDLQSLSTRAPLQQRATKKITRLKLEASLQIWTHITQQVLHFDAKLRWQLCENSILYSSPFHCYNCVVRKSKAYYPMNLDLRSSFKNQARSKNRMNGSKPNI